MRVSLFITCYNDTLFPEIGIAVVRVLERLGHTIDFPYAQTCCGQMHYNTGYQPEALPLVRRFVEVFRDSEVVCVPSSSCVTMMREHYEKIALASGDMTLQSEVATLLPRVYEFTELLVHRLGVEDVGAVYPHCVTYHSSCHSLRNLHLGDVPVRLLRNVRGLELIPMEAGDLCCGFGGTFSIKNPDVSGAMLQEKLQYIQKTQAEVCTACDNSCLMHIGGALHRQRANMRTEHIATILASEGDSSVPSNGAR
ncbi:MAG TPA: (Fe-S)-binding protein [Acidobacteriaceae bacterium]|jgi:L-lactate dehydrogenase complex protein LldE